MGITRAEAARRRAAREALAHPGAAMAAALGRLAASTVLKAEFVPTGLQEDIIEAVGCGKYRIVAVLDANRVGKTTTLMNIAKSIIWGPGESPHYKFWQGENVFHNWPYKARRFRITGTPTNLADNGVVQQTLSQWWPSGKYHRDKGGKHFYCSFSCDNGWVGDALTYDQSPTEFEGQTLSLVLSDEPPKPSLVGPIMSRMAEGGIWIVAMTPINCGAFLDTLDDLKEAGSSVKILSGTIYENDSVTGKPNHNNTKRGLWTKAQIDDYVATTPKDERDARLLGKATHKSGKIFDEFDREIHTLSLDLNSAYFRSGQAYQCIDPHVKYYPFCQWWMMLPDGVRYCYNEWPMYEDFGCYYDEIRNSKDFRMTIEQLSDVIRTMDLPQLGIKVQSRFIDPFFASGLGGYDWKNQTESISKEFAKNRLNFSLPDRGKMGLQIDNIRNLLHWEKSHAISPLNRPMLMIAPWCKNTIRSFERHYWLEGKQMEAETYKDPIDTARMFTAKVSAYEVREVEKKEPYRRPTSDLTDTLRETSLSGL